MDISNEEIVREYSKMVYPIAVSQVGNQNDADDVYQDVFLQLVRNIHKIKDEEHLKYWLIRATINRCKRHFLAPWKKRQAELIPEIAQGEGGIPSELYFLVQALPEKYKSVIHLHYYEGYSVEEIAKILGMKTGTVKTRLFRGRKLLEEEMEV